MSAHPSHTEIMAQAARAAGALIRQHFSHRVRETHKHDDSPVTEIDVAAERIIIDTLVAHFPYAIVGEESGGTIPSSGLAWVIDPIDGTSNFMHGVAYTCVAIGLLKDGVPLEGVIYDAIRDELFSTSSHSILLNGKPAPALAGRARPYVSYDPNAFVADCREFYAIVSRLVHEERMSARAFGSCALSLAYVAAGRIDAYFGKGQSPWDHVAGMALCGQAGITMTDWSGASMRVDAKTSLVARSELHARLLPHFKGA